MSDERDREIDQLMAQLTKQRDDFEAEIARHVQRMDEAERAFAEVIDRMVVLGERLGDHDLLEKLKYVRSKLCRLTVQ